MSKFFLFSRLNKRIFAQGCVLPWYKKIDFQSKIAKIFLVAILAFFGISYLIQVNMNATSGFQITDLQKRIESMQKENKKLEIQITGLRSIENIEQIQSIQQLEKVSSITYIPEKEPIVALGK